MILFHFFISLFCDFVNEAVERVCRFLSQFVFLS